MNTKKLLTSFAVFGVMSMPAFADIASNAESATCDSSTIGVSDGSTILEAQWTAQTGSCPSGQYLNASTASCTDCPVGSYCAGGEYTYNGSNIGISACETGYTSAGNSELATECYIADTAACATVNPYSGPNAAKVTGVTYGNSTNGSASCKTYYGSNTCTLDTANACDITAVSCAAGYTPQSFNLETAFSAAEQTNTDTTTFGYTNNSGQYDEGIGDKGTSKSQVYYGISANNEWAVSLDDYSFGVVKGQARCSSTPGSNGDYTNGVYDANGDWSNTTTIANLADETDAEGAIHCYCNVTGYKASGSDSFVSLGSSWVFFSSYVSASDCVYGCALGCAMKVMNFSDFRGALFGAVQPTSPSCEANTIGITWKPQNGEANTVNQCTYNGAVTIPATPSKVGYDFAGWHVNNAQ